MGCESGNPENQSHKSASSISPNTGDTQTITKATTTVTAIAALIDLMNSPGIIEKAGHRLTH
jgi:hypothetical protein